MTFIQLSMSTGQRRREPADLARRALDLIAATAGLVCLCPLLLLISLAILIDTGRPILFSQIRLGQRGRQFYIYKFRKFHAQIGARASLVTVRDDPRFTRLGRLLERTKLDELPQLWNILKGDMSIVGPRPETLDLAGCFADAQLKVLEHRPGIFGPNQYYFRDEKSLYPADSDPETFYREILFPLKAGIDAEYFANRTIFTDVGWFIRGVAAVVGWPDWGPREPQRKLGDWVGRERFGGVADRVHHWSIGTGAAEGVKSGL
jgi:lipopolysaccharide/colanic/teichoic acid biosynthesis glycosyltransferase